jgi:putative aldouronate transport system permease protein
LGKRRALTHLRRDWQLYALLSVPVTYVIIFCYVPMYGVQIAFRDYQITKGFFASPWVGLEHFITFFNAMKFKELIRNTLSISVYDIVAGFFPPIVLAVSLNEVRSRFVKKSMQMVTYAPYFISTVVITSIVIQVLSWGGLVNNLLHLFGIAPVEFLGKPRLFSSIYVWSGVWQSAGYSSILYLSILSSINPELYDAAVVDGASIWDKIFHIDLPQLVPTAVIILILACGRVLNVGFEKVFLLQNDVNIIRSDVIATYVYRVGLVMRQYDFSTAVSLFQSVIALILLASVNWVAKKFGYLSLW